MCQRRIHGQGGEISQPELKKEVKNEKRGYKWEKEKYLTFDNLGKG